mmetsp:Transcript_126899/g.224967  ORF Transcript_126899/g.224967 Transcript_126899/m.224967 type:complete len:273 (+) Transcript_126899:71-889(+)
MADDWDPFADPADVDKEEKAAEKAAPDNKESSGDQIEQEPSWYGLKPIVKDRKIRVACFHGTASSSKIMRMQLAPLNRLAGFKDMVELVYIEGSIYATEDPKNHMIASMQKAFPNQSLFQYVRYDWESQYGMSDYKNIDEFVTHAESQMQANGPIDGVISFSQGSILALMLAARAQSGDGMPLAFLVHMCSSAPMWTYRYKDLFQAPLAIPSLFITGEKDTIAQGCVELPKYYSKPMALCHSADHRPFPPARQEADELASEVFSFMKRSALA